MPDAAELNRWIDRLKAAKKHSEIFKILDEFRPLDWTDEQRAAIAKLYMRLLDIVADDKDELKAQDNNAAQVPDKNPADEEVWYEKM